MDKKTDTAKAIIDEIIAAQSRPFETGRYSPLPPMISVGDGRHFKASNAAFDLIWEYARLLSQEFDGITSTILERELADMVARSVALVFDEHDPGDLAKLSRAETRSAIDDRIEHLLAEQRFEQTFFFGCAFLHGDGVGRVEVGPVAFEPREEWLRSVVEAGKLDDATARRIAKHWHGQRLRKRDNAMAAAKERHLLDAIEDCPTACTVKTGKLSTKSAPPKAMLAARLAMTFVALMWKTPSKALGWMGLRADGLPYHQTYAVRGQTDFVGASYTSISSKGGQYAGPDWTDNWKEFEPLCAPVAETLRLFVSPETPSSRPDILRSLFMSLWWFHEACRERSDLLAIAKFASSMDALAGGDRARGINKLITNLLGVRSKKPWLTDGRSPHDIVKEIYEVLRNNIIHGSIKHFDRDWSASRGRSEFVARRCLVACLEWMERNPGATKSKEMLR